MLFVIYSLFTLSFVLMVLLFCILFGVLPGRWHKRRITQIQMIFSSVIFGTGLLAFLFSFFYFLYPDANSLFEPSFIMIFLLLYALIFFASLRRYYVYKKEKIEDDTEEWELKKEEYTIIKEWGSHLGDHISMPNMKSCAKYGENLIIFFVSCPLEEIDAVFTVNKLEEKVYGCSSYIPQESNRGKKRMLYGILTFFQVALLKITDGTKGLGRILHWIVVFCYCY